MTNDATNSNSDDVESTTNATRNNKRKRRRDATTTLPQDQGSCVGANFDAGGGEEVQQGSSDLKEIITSLVLLEDQDKCDRQEWDSIARHHLSLIQSNHRKKTHTMLDCYSTVQHCYDDAIDRLKRSRSRAAALTSASASAVVLAAASSIDNDKNAHKSTGATSSSSVGQHHQHHHHRRLWVKDRSKAWWDECSSPDFPEEDFRRAFRMGKSTFDTICDELNSAVAKEDTMLRAAIPVRQRVAVCIWRLATGEPLRLVSKRFGLGISTCHKLVLEVCNAIRTVLMPKYLQWPDDESLRRIKDQFESVSGIPNVVGSMYTTHIPIIAPKISVGSYFNKRHTERNQKTSYSITVQGVVDPKGAFTDVCIGWPGSMSDDKVLEMSHLFQRASQGLLNGVWVVGGSSYPLTDWVLVPYKQQNLTWTQHAFNEKVGEIQRISKDAFSRLKGRWSCLQKRTEVKLQDLPIVLGACCVLHNICEIKGEKMDPDLHFELVDDQMIPEVPLRSMTAMKARDSIAHNLLHHGIAGTGFL